MYKFFLISIVGALLNLDNRIMGQVMISRPFIAGTILGFIFGDVKTGILVGSIVELIWISVISMGGAVPINACVIGIVAAGGVVLMNNLSGEVVILAICFAIFFSWLFKILDVWFRNKSALFNRYVEQWIDEDKIKKIVFSGWGIILIIFIGNFLFYFVAFVGVTWAIGIILKLMSFYLTSGLRFAYQLLPFLGFAIAWNSFVLKLMSKVKKPKANIC